MIGDILTFLEAMSVFRAPVTRTLVGINVAIHLALCLLSGEFIAFSPGSVGHQVFQVFGLVPVDFWTGSVWQPVSSMFLHGNIIHIAFNMIALWSLGSPIEHKVGSAKFFVLYFVSGLMGALFVVAFQSDLGNPTIGASGAVVGLLGALAVFFPRAKLLLFFFPVKARTAAIIFGVGSLLLALTSQAQGLSHLGHLGGLIGGVLFTWLALAPSKEERMDPGPDVGGGFRMGGSRRTGPSHTTGPEEQVLRMMQELMRQRQSGAAGPGAPPEGRRVKEINPMGDTDRFEEPNRKPPEDGPPGNDNSPGSGRLYYDPASGRFFFK